LIARAAWCVPEAIDMWMNPYRMNAIVPAVAQAPRDASVFCVALVVWASSVLRAVVGALRHESASEELALAFVLTVAIPLFARRRIGVHEDCHSAGVTRRARRVHARARGG